VSGVSTIGASQVQIGLSLKVGRNASRYWQLFASTNGTTWTPVSGGVGAVTNIGVGTQSPSSATINNAGLIAITAANDAYTNSNPSGYASFSYTLPTGLGYENVSTFGFRALAAWAPGGASYIAASPTGVYAGSGVGAGILVDMVTVSAVPEPAACWLAAIAAMGAGCVVIVCRNRRRMGAPA
jgi:hypothetical protein